MNYKVKKVKTELSLGITIEYEDGLVKGMSLFDILDQKPELKKLHNNPVVFLKPLISTSKDTIEWWSNGEAISLEASVIYEKGQTLSEREGHYVATIRELSQCVGHGNTPEEAIANVKKQQLNSIYQLLSEGKEVPPPIK